MSVVNRSILLGFMGAILSIIVIVGLVSGLYRDQLNVNSKRSQFFAVRDSVIADVEEHNYLAENIPAFSVMMEFSKEGTVQRKHWVEVLSAAKIALNLPSMQFDIYPIEKINTGPATYSINVSHETIELKLGLLHEGELQNLLNYLEHHISSPYEITALDVQLVESKENSGITLPQEINIQVNCTIRWYSIGMQGDNIDQA